jgi:internalin A
MADKKEILTFIEQVAKEGRTELDLSKNELTSLPPEITKLTNLTSLKLSHNRLKSLPRGSEKLTNLTNLDLSHNHFKSLPPGIAKLTNLTTLDLNGNQLTLLPPGIAKLTNLTHLDLNGNKLTSLPPEISKLTSLTTLLLWDNQLTSLPPEIIELTNLTLISLGNNQLLSVPMVITKMTNLTSLGLSYEQLTSLPPEIIKLTNLAAIHLFRNQFTSLPLAITELANLIAIDLGQNQLTSLPPEIAKLTKLTHLDLNNNQLTSLPPEIAKLTKLTHLDLDNNQLTTLPPEIAKLTNLTSLKLTGNRLTSLPAEIAGLTNLTKLDLEGNPLSIPPETLANPEDVKAIFAAIAGLRSGERLNEAKMLVVGDGKVGKSSVVERFIYNTYDPNKETTLGVEINDEMQVVHSEVKGDGEPVKLNIWDFGGQEIQHSTHQFFFTTRSLYLLVVDARKGDQLNNIEYWLKLIQSFGGDSPIIIVINQIDQLKGQRPLNLDRKALQEKYNIRDFVETSCQTGEGIAVLKAVIGSEVVQLKHVRDIWPREWLAIKQRLQGIQADYIPVETYLAICREEKLDDEGLQQSLLDILHVLGTVIRFPGDTQVLNPRWVTQGVYRLLTSEQLVDDQGQFDLKDVGKILAGLPDAKEHYPSHTHERLIKVMQHFELCFEFTDRPGHYLIPAHLHDNEPNTLWDDAGSLKFQYHYETLPDSVISRFIVRMNQYIVKPDYWKNGVFLESGEGDKNLAKIKADLVDRKIFIAINGKEQTRRAFLAVIRSALDEINSSFKIGIKQMIPVPGSQEALVSYQDLLAYEEMDEPQIVIPELRKKFSVRELLDGVEEVNTRMKRSDRDLSERRLPQRTLEKIHSKPQERILRIVVASPIDVQPERDVLPSVIDEVNRVVAADRGLRLELSRWETDTHPGFHSEGLQGLIDPILKVTDCDLLIGIFWKRFGTPTADGKTGTEHEFGLAYEAWLRKRSPQIFVYFNLKAYTPKSKAEAEQWGRVLEFRDRFPKEGLWWPYKGKVQFEKLIRNHLMNYIRSLA